MLLNIPTVAAEIDSLFSSRKTADSQIAVGKIFGIQSKTHFLFNCLMNESSRCGALILLNFYIPIDKKENIGIILDVYLLDQAQWIKVLTKVTINQSWR